MVPSIYFGTVSNLCPYFQDNVEEWQKYFIEGLRQAIEKQCPYCVNKVPFEGYVIRKENANPLRLKLKSKAFLLEETHHLDTQEKDIESEN